MKKILLILGVALVIGLASCENEIDPGQNSLIKMSNEWWAQIYVPDGSGGLTDIGQGYQHLLTSNTASGTSVGFWVTKKIPTPFDLINLMIVSIWLSSALLASLNIRCASSINMTNLG